MVKIFGNESKFMLTNRSFGQDREDRAWTIRRKIVNKMLVLEYFINFTFNIHTTSQNVKITKQFS